MSAAPTKSQSLHNVSSFLLSTRRFDGASAGSSGFQNGGAPPDDPAAVTALPQMPAPHRGIGSRSNRNQRFSVSSLAPSPALKSVANGKDTAAPEEKPRRANACKENEEEVEEEEGRRMWNLRPRKKSDMFSSEMFVCGEGQGAKQRAGCSEPKSNRLRGIAESPAIGCGERKKEKRRLWIALSRDEIEEDIFIMTGNKPSRRPKKHPKIVQKKLDTVFPGLSLVGSTADSFKGTDSSFKR